MVGFPRCVIMQDGRGVGGNPFLKKSHRKIRNFDIEVGLLADV